MVWLHSVSQCPSLKYWYDLFNFVTVWERWSFHFNQFIDQMHIYIYKFKVYLLKFYIYIILYNPKSMKENFLSLSSLSGQKILFSLQKKIHNLLTIVLSAKNMSVRKWFRERLEKDTLGYFFNWENFIKHV